MYGISRNHDTFTGVNAVQEHDLPVNFVRKFYGGLKFFMSFTYLAPLLSAGGLMV